LIAFNLRRIGLSFFILALFPSCINAQTFSLADTVFVVGSEHQLPVMLNNFSDDHTDIFYKENPEYFDSLRGFISNHPELKIELGVCTDYRGADSYNQSMSESQAGKFIQWLASIGIKTNNMVWKGYGETRLVNTPEMIDAIETVEAQEFAHGQNGRVILKILEIKRDN
jgi:hypothetical protein